MKSFCNVVHPVGRVLTRGTKVWDSCPARGLTSAFWGDWDGLNTRLWRGHPLLDSRFVRPLLEYFGTGSEWLLTCRREGRLSAAAVLNRQAPGIWQSFLPPQAQLSPVLVPDLSMALEMVEHLPGFGVSIDFLCQDPLYSPVGRSKDAGKVVLTPYGDTMAVSLRLGFDDYWEARSRKLRNNIGRYVRRAEQAGLDMHADRISAPVDLARAVSRYGDLESRGWKGLEGTAIHRGNMQGRFYAEVMDGFGSTGNAEVFELRIGGQLAASRLLIRNAAFRVALKTTYDESLREYAPGRILLYRMLRSMAEETEPHRVEFYTKATKDQLAWATEQRAIVHARVFRWNWLKGAYRTLEGVRRRQREEAEQDPEGVASP